jgi:NAD(P)-dependent dehydrogenase (short-subunit alcohol dehydrogenase family)
MGHRDGRLAGKVAVVIGGAGGFGGATIQRFADEGATVVVAGRDHDAAEQAAQRVGGTGLRCDITIEDDVAALVATTVQRHGGVHVMVNYAGYQLSTPISELDAVSMRAMVDVQLVGAVQVIRYAANAMADGGGGSIVSVSSLTAHAPARGLAAYAGAKAGLEYVTRIAAVEYGAAGVRVNCVAPHLIETPMTATIFAVPLAVEAVRRQTPLGRMGHVDDVANAVLFLAGDESGYITGQTVCVDGGASNQKLPSVDDYALLAAHRPDLLDPSGSRTERG